MGEQTQPQNAFGQAQNQVIPALRFGWGLESVRCKSFELHGLRLDSSNCGVMNKNNRFSVTFKSNL